MYADVVLPSRRFQVFTYHIPPQLQSQISVGSPVQIPLGTSVVSGVIVRLVDKLTLSSVRSSKPTLKFRDVLSVDLHPENSTLDHKLLTLVEQISDYYLAPLAACLPLIVPPRVVKVSKRLFLTEAGRQSLSSLSLQNEDQLVLQKLSRRPNGTLRSSLFKTLPKAGTLVTKLKRKGWIEERSTLPSRVSTKSPGKPSTAQIIMRVSQIEGMEDLFEKKPPISPKRSLSPSRILKQQQVVANELLNACLSGTFQKHLIIETEQNRLQIFQHVASTLFQKGKRVLFLVPEVHQVEVMVSSFGEMGFESVEAYHGKLSAPIRSNCWERIRQGHVQIVVGTRSALFVPLPDLGLIWVDQEEDASYKEEHLPYYHAREVAGMRGAIEQATVVLGSSCPSLETYAEFPNKNQEAFQIMRLNSPDMHVIDMRDQVSGTLLAPSLVERLANVLNKGQQAIMIVNRKGFSQSLICRDCGKTPACESCGVSLRLFLRPSRLVCLYCEKNYSTPETCSSCRGTVFRHSGVGTQRLEEEITKLFPAHSVFRFDRDRVKTAEEGSHVLRKFRQGEISLLIGTEFLLHQSHPPTAKLVAFPQADLGLHLPDFRSAERTFRLFSKAVGLAHDPAYINGSSGEMVFQTRMPDHHVFQAMVQRNPQLFYQRELDLREALAYPPSTHILLLVVTGAQATRVQPVVDFLDQQVNKSNVLGVLLQGVQGRLELPMILGPLSSRKPGRLKKNRTIFLIKTFDLQETQRQLRKIQQVFDQQFAKQPVVYEVQVDPLEIQ